MNDNIENDCNYEVAHLEKKKKKKSRKKYSSSKCDKISTVFFVLKIQEVTQQASTNSLYRFWVTC